MSSPTSSRPRISVLLPIYNGGKYLDEALHSIAIQTFEDFEVLAIDDHSTDNSAAIVRSWVDKDPRFRLLTHIGPNGLPYGLNFGLQAAQGEFIARMDQDDISRPNRFARQVDYLDSHPAIALVGTGYLPFGGDSRGRPVFHPTSSPVIAWQQLTNTRFAHPTVMFRRAIVDRIGNYPIQEAEDFGFFSKVVQNFPTANINEVLLDYREHGGNMSTLRREKITQGVLTTFSRNFRHYVQDDNGREVFYQFQVGRVVQLKNVLFLWRLSWKILSRIRQDYKLSSVNLSWWFAIIHVKNLFLRSVVRGIFRLPSVAPKQSFNS